MRDKIFPFNALDESSSLISLRTKRFIKQLKDLGRTEDCYETVSDFEFPFH